MWQTIIGQSSEASSHTAEATTDLSCAEVGAGVLHQREHAVGDLVRAPPAHSTHGEQGNHEIHKKQAESAPGQVVESVDVNEVVHVGVESRPLGLVRLPRLGHHQNVEGVRSLLRRVPQQTPPALRRILLREDTRPGSSARERPKRATMHLGLGFLGGAFAPFHARASKVLNTGSVSR